jgi:hypothetical protein
MRLTRLAASGAAIAVVGFGASGCASMHSTPMEVDTAYVAYVEHAAKLFNTQVIWINPPLRPARTLAATDTPAKAVPAATPQ